MISLSASLIRDFLVCNKRADYRLHYAGEAVASKEMTIGTIVHSVLENQWSDKTKALALASELIKSHNLKSDTDKVYDNVSSFFDLFPANYFSKTDLIEKYFKIKYQDNFYLTGKMDRVHKDMIFDWKTGRRPPENLDHDVQMILYYLAYKKMYNKVPTCVYVSLSNKKLYYFKPLDSIINEFENKILPAVAKSIEHGQFIRTGLFAYKACEYCAFNNICYTELGLE